MKSEISPMQLTYFMMKWDKQEQVESDIACSECGEGLKLMKEDLNYLGSKYNGYVCHKDKRVIWVRAH